MFLFKDVYLMKHLVRRASLDSYFWPVDYRFAARDQLLIDRGWHEGWYCNFTENGLALDITYFLTEAQLKNWPADRRLNPNIIEESVTWAGDYELTLPPASLRVSHAPEQIEAVRKKIYISAKFREKAERMWAAQFFTGEKPQNGLQYHLGFQRETTHFDHAQVALIRSEMQADPGLGIVLD